MPDPKEQLQRNKPVNKMLAARKENYSKNIHESQFLGNLSKVQTHQHEESL